MTYSEPLSTAAAVRTELQNDLHAHFASCHAAFLSIDVDRSGRIEADELARVLAVYSLPGEAASPVLARLDRDQDGRLDYNEFCAAYFGSRSPAPSPKQAAPLPGAPARGAPAMGDAEAAADAISDHLSQHYRSARKAFLKLDADRSGYVSAAELRAIEAEYNLPMERVIQACDVNGDSRLSFNEVAKRLFVL
mmetsp:Transcript_34520/g.88325  ORF Transcript_34520/g.88325 Transcript_34520/m.88325 type:complete len:193 (+) Transcript_34520:205-783(+)